MPSGGGGGTLHAVPTSVGLSSIWPLQLLSRPSQTSGLGPTLLHLRAPVTHCSVPVLHSPTPEPQTPPVSVRLSSTVPSQSSSLALHVSSRSPGWTMFGPAQETAPAMHAFAPALAS